MKSRYLIAYGLCISPTLNYLPMDKFTEHPFAGIKLTMDEHYKRLLDVKRVRGMPSTLTLKEWKCPDKAWDAYIKMITIEAQSNSNHHALTELIDWYEGNTDDKLYQKLLNEHLGRRLNKEYAEAYFDFTKLINP